MFQKSIWAADWDGMSPLNSQPPSLVTHMTDSHFLCPRPYVENSIYLFELTTRPITGEYMKHV